MKSPYQITILALASTVALLALSGCQSAGLQTSDRTSPSSPTDRTETGADAAAPSMAYLFGWGELPADRAKPRGGTTRGTPVTLAPAQSLPLPEIANAENTIARDRAAIFALAGDFRTSFHFMETLGLIPEHEPGKPYHSWATEHVRVLEDTGRFISLQHTLVMFFQNGDGSASEPMLVKHWRQDWIYEPAELHTFRGARTWERRRLSPQDAAGAWSQSVWQVDDSPRYAAVGRWSHDGNRSVWTGETSWRPLPRREFSARQDYNVLEGVHKIVLTPTGWLHVQDNWKRVAGDASSYASFVAHEYGLDRYERITAPSLAAADDYWRTTGAYWDAARAAWRGIYAQHDRFSLRAKVDGARLFEEHFAYAEKLADGAPFDSADAERHARETIARFLIEIAGQDAQLGTDA